MADINWTTALPMPSGMTFGLRTNALDFASPLTGVVQSVAMPGARWIATLQWAALRRTDADLLQALMVQMRGRTNRLVMWNVVRPTVRGVGGGSPLVNGSGQTGSTINIDGLPVNTNGIYIAGDFLGIGSELKMVTATVNSNGSGQAAVSFEPPLRAAPADNSAIVTTQPTAKFMLMNNEVSWQHTNPMSVGAFEMQLAEVFT